MTTKDLEEINLNAIVSIASFGSTGAEVTFSDRKNCWINYGAGQRELNALICALEEIGLGKGQNGNEIEWQMNDIAEDGNYEGKTEEEQEDYTFDSLDWTITIK